jgi:hypothetical protein
MEKPVLWELEDQLVKVFGRDPKRVHQGGLDSARYFGDPSLVITAFDYVNFSKWHGMTSFFAVAFR